jgi:putative Mg2+ transporter-C (MgtC) family protein
MNIQQFCTRIFVALICGLFIGLERQLNHKNAGIRTNGLVALGAAIFVLLSFEINATNGGDISRIIGQVVTGVGFLCAGVIFHQGTIVQGLTTAATIWCSAAIGCLAAAGYFAEAFVCSITVIIVNALLRFADTWIDSKVTDTTNKK